METLDSEEDKVVDLALEYVKKQPNLLPNTELRAERYYIDIDVSGLRTIQAGSHLILQVSICHEYISPE